MVSNQHIEVVFSQHSNQDRKDYRIRLNASVDCVRFLLRQGLAFRGDKESDGSKNSGNFLELMKFLASHNDEIKSVALKNALGNSQTIAPIVQKRSLMLLLLKRLH